MMLSLRVHVLNNWVPGIVGTSNSRTGLEEVIDYPARGPIGYSIW